MQMQPIECPREKYPNIFIARLSDQPPRKKLRPPISISTMNSEGRQDKRQNRPYVLSTVTRVRVMIIIVCVDEMMASDT